MNKETYLKRHVYLNKEYVSETPSKFLSLTKTNSISNNQYLGPHFLRCQLLLAIYVHSDMISVCFSQKHRPALMNFRLSKRTQV